MANSKDKNSSQGAPVQGDFAAFSGFEKKCASGKGNKGKAGK